MSAQYGSQTLSKLLISVYRGGTCFASTGMGEGAFSQKRLGREGEAAAGVRHGSGANSQSACVSQQELNIPMDRTPREHSQNARPCAPPVMPLECLFTRRPAHGNCVLSLPGPGCPQQPKQQTTPKAPEAENEDHEQSTMRHSRMTARSIPNRKKRTTTRRRLCLQ